MFYTLFRNIYINYLFNASKGRFETEKYIASLILRIFHHIRSNKHCATFFFFSICLYFTHNIL